MISFATLFEALDRTTNSLDKVAAMDAYFRSVPAADGAWALYFLLGNRLKRAVKSGQLLEWVSEVSGHPRWLAEDCYAAVGDLAETLALLLPSRTDVTSLSLSQLVEQRLLPLAVATAATQRELLKRTWAELGSLELFLWHKMITGGLRVAVARGLVIRAMAGLANVDESLMAARLAGKWNPTAVEFERILSGEDFPLDPSRPYPFCLASPLELALGELGNPESWQVEWKWDGIRAQLIHRASLTMLWSRGDELVSDYFPEVMEAAQRLPLGTVLDGEILAWQGNEVLPFQVLQRRLQRREPPAEILRQVPVVFLVYDLLELESKDVRGETLEWRRRTLEALIQGCLSSQRSGMGKRVLWVQGELFNAPTIEESESNPIRLAPLLNASGWAEVEALHRKAREMRTAGLMLKSRRSVYETGRQRDVWWKWKAEPFTCDCVLVAAQPGFGRRASLCTYYTFAVWQDGVLLPVAKVDSGLTEVEAGLVDDFVREHTIARFGPMRSVKPELVFELAFDGIATSTRNQSGLALRFPRITRWRRDKLAREADTLEVLRTLEMRS